MDANIAILMAQYAHNVCLGSILMSINNVLGVKIILLAVLNVKVIWPVLLA